MLARVILYLQFAFQPLIWFGSSTYGYLSMNWLLNPWVIPNLPTPMVNGMLSSLHNVISCIPVFGGVISFIPVLGSLYGAFLYHVYLDGTGYPDVHGIKIEMSDPDTQWFFVGCWCLGISRLKHFRVISADMTIFLFFLIHLVIVFEIDSILQWLSDVREKKIFVSGQWILLTPLILHVCQFLIEHAPTGYHTAADRKFYDDPRAVIRGMDVSMMYITIQSILYIAFGLQFLVQQIWSLWEFHQFKMEISIYEGLFTSIVIPIIKFIGYVSGF